MESNKKNNTIKENLHNLLCNSQSVKFNNIVINKESKALYDRIILVDQHSSFNVELFTDLLIKQPKEYSTYLKHFNIDIDKQPISFYNKIILNLLCLLTTKNKIIILDSLLLYIKDQDKSIINDLLNQIRKNNSVFVVGKGKYD